MTDKEASSLCREDPEGSHVSPAIHRIPLLVCGLRDVGKSMRGSFPGQGGDGGQGNRSGGREPATHT